MPYLTDKNLSQRPVGDAEYYIWDTAVKGFGVRVPVSGLKEYVYRVRTTDPADECIRTIADVNVIDCSQARKISDTLLKQQGVPAGAEDAAGRGRGSAKKTEEDIIAAAAEVFLTHGYDAQLELIATTASVTRATIYAYFKNKEELFVRAVLHTASSIFDNIVTPQGQGVRETLKDIAMTYRRIMLGDRALSFFRLTISDHARLPQVARELEALGTTRIMSLVTAYLGKVLAPGTSPERILDLTELFFAAIVGSSRSRRLRGVTDHNAVEEERYVNTVIDGFIEALRRDGLTA